MNRLLGQCHLLSLGFFFCLSGCVFVPPALEGLPRLKAGQTQDEVVSILGLPLTRIEQQDGTVLLSYTEPRGAALLGTPKRAVTLLFKGDQLASINSAVNLKPSAVKALEANGLPVQGMLEPPKTRQ